jgi:hypothetical protein
MSNESERREYRRREAEERERAAQAAQKRQRELEEIPPKPVDETTWPKGVRSLSLDEDALGVDAKGELYWHGKPVEIRRPLDLTPGQKTYAWIIGAAAVITALAEGVQAIVAVAK